MTGFRMAWAFLTRLPGGAHPSDDRALGRSVPWFPIVGAVIGIITAAIYVGLLVVAPPLVSAAVAVLVGVAVTGAFHEDGLADTFDGLGGTTPERRLEIMRDSRVGTFGTVAVVGSILVRVAAVAALPATAAWLAMPIAHGLGRAMAVGAMVRSEAARPDGLGVGYLAGLPRRAASAVVLLVVAGSIAAGSHGWVLATTAIATAYVAVRWFAARFDGVSGDVLGAVEQLVEMAVLVAAVSVMPGGLTWSA